jgi:hypothetical protein
MSQYLKNEIKTVVPTGTALSAEVKSEKIDVSNSQSVKLVITSSEGDAATTNAKIVAVLADATEQEIKVQEITVGAKTETKIDIVADEIAHYEAKEFIVVLDAIAESTLTCGVIAILGENRYTE